METFQEPVCCVCDGVKAESICLQCQDMLCSPCTEAHKKLSATRSHDVESLSTVTPERLAASRPPMRNDHDDRATTADNLLKNLMDRLVKAERELNQTIGQFVNRLHQVDGSEHNDLAHIDMECDRLQKLVEDFRNKLKEISRSSHSKVRKSLQDVKTTLDGRLGKVTSHKLTVALAESVIPPPALLPATQALADRVNNLDLSADLDSDVWTNPSQSARCCEDVVKRMEKEIQMLDVALDPRTSEKLLTSTESRTNRVDQTAENVRGRPSEESWSTHKVMNTSRMRFSRQTDDRSHSGPRREAKFSMWGRTNQGTENLPVNRYSLLNSMHEGGNRRSFGQDFPRGDTNRREGSWRDRDKDVTWKRNRDSYRNQDRETAVASTRGGGGGDGNDSSPLSRDQGGENSTSHRSLQFASTGYGQGRRSENAVNRHVVTVTPKDIEAKAKAIIENYLLSQDIIEATELLDEFSSLDKSKCVTLIINMILERPSQARLRGGELLFQLTKCRGLTVDELISGLRGALEEVELSETEKPEVWQHLGEIMGPLMLDNLILPLKFLREALQGLIKRRGKNMTAVLLAEALKVVCQQKSRSEIAHQWRTSHLEITDFVEEEAVASFIQEKDLGWLQSEEDTPSRRQLGPPGCLRERLVEKLSDKHNDSEKIFDFIEKNTSEEEQRSTQFIRDLMTGVCVNAISGGPGNAKLIPENIHYRRPVLVRYLEAKPEYELQALYALQALVHSFEHPPDLLRNFFDILYDEEIINEDSFNRWAASDDPAEQEGKGVAKLNTTQFFIWIREVS